MRIQIILLNHSTCQRDISTCKAVSLSRPECNAPPGSSRPLRCWSPPPHLPVMTVPVLQGPTRTWSTTLTLVSGPLIFCIHLCTSCMYLFMFFMIFTVFLQNKARREEFCPKNLKKMHTVVDKLMAHSHLKYKGRVKQCVPGAVPCTRVCTYSGWSWLSSGRTQSGSHTEISPFEYCGWGLEPLSNPALSWSCLGKSWRWVSSKMYLWASDLFAQAHCPCWTVASSLAWGGTTWRQKSTCSCCQCWKLREKMLWPEQVIMSCPFLENWWAATDDSLTGSTCARVSRLCICSAVLPAPWVQGTPQLLLLGFQVTQPGLGHVPLSTVSHHPHWEELVRCSSCRSFSKVGKAFKKTTFGKILFILWIRLNYTDTPVTLIHIYMKLDGTYVD